MLPERLADIYTCTSTYNYACHYSHVRIFCYSEDVFTVTCGRTGVGNITSIDLYLDGEDGWHVDWVEIDNGLETVRINCDQKLEDYETHRFLID